MKTLEKAGPVSKSREILVEDVLNNTTISKVEAAKVEAAKTFLKNHPVPAHLLKK